MNLDQKHCQLGLCALLLAGLTACGQSEPQESPPPPPKVSTVTLVPASLELREELPGRVSALRSAEIRPQVSGIVQRRLFEQGSEVTAGQALFQINPAPFQAEVDTASANLQRAEAALARTALQASRLQTLVDSEAVSRQVYDDAVSQRDQALADAAQARAALLRRQLDLKFARVEAPINGRIDQALVSEGALVSSTDSSPMARIQQIDQVYVDLRRPAASLDALREAIANRNAQTAKADKADKSDKFGKPDSADDAWPVAVLRPNGEAYDLKGRILFSGISVDAGTGDVLLRILVDNPQRQLLPGMFVRARVPHTSYQEALTVPQQALVFQGERPQVWVLDASNHARLAAVELGELVDRHYRIRSGLSAGQKVVVEGMERLTDGVLVSAQAWKISGLTPSVINH